MIIYILYYTINRRWAIYVACKRVTCHTCHVIPYSAIPPQLRTVAYPEAPAPVRFQIHAPPASILFDQPTASAAICYTVQLQLTKRLLCLRSRQTTPRRVTKYSRLLFGVRASSMPVSRRLGQSRSSHSRKRATTQQNQEGDWYSIKRILDQREQDGYTEYLVDWDDHHITGESYPPSWVRCLRARCAKVHFANPFLK